MLGLSLRFSIRSYLTVSRTYLPTYFSAFRTLSTTPKRLTTKVPDRDSFIDSIKHTALFQKIADKPNAVKAFYDLHTLIKEMGLDKPSSAPPSVYQGFKLVTNRRFAKAAKRVMEELKEAGVKLNSEEALGELMAMTQKIRPNEKSRPNKKGDPNETGDS